MTDYQPIGRQILIDKREYKRRFFHSPLGIINPLHLTRQKFLNQFKNNMFPPSIPSKNKQCDLDLIGKKVKIHKDDPNQIFQEFNLKDLLPRHIARPYVYVKRVNKKLSPKERGTMIEKELEVYNYAHNSEWNKSTHLKSHKLIKNSNQEQIEQQKSLDELNKEEREQFYELSQKQTQHIFDFFKLLKLLLKLKTKSTSNDLKGQVQEFIKKNKKLVHTDQIFFTKSEIQEFIDTFSHQLGKDKPKDIVNNFFSCVYDEKLCLNKISMKAVVYNFNRYYESKFKIEQKFSLAKANKLNAQIHYDACYWTHNYKTLVENLKQMESQESEAQSKILSLYGDKLHGQFKQLIDERNKNMKRRVILAKFFKDSLQVKNTLDIEIIAKAFIQKILSKSQEIALFQDFISSYFEDKEDRKSELVLKKEELAEYLIKISYPKEDADVIINKIVHLYKYAQEHKQANSNIIVRQVDKETFLEFLKINLKKQDSKMSIFIKMMNQIQQYFEEEVEIRDIKEKSAKKYEMNMIANFILRYLQKIDRTFLKAQWKIMSILKAFQENNLTLSKLEGILNSHGIPSSFTLKFLFSSQVYQKKSNFLCQERQLAQWKIDLQKALGIYKQEIQKMKNFFEDMGNNLNLEGSDDNSDSEENDQEYLENGDEEQQKQVEKGDEHKIVQEPSKRAISKHILQNYLNQSQREADLISIKSEVKNIINF